MNKRLDFIDFFRGIAVLLVTTHRILQMNPDMINLFASISIYKFHLVNFFNGYGAVELFFIISGFCLTIGLKKNNYSISFEEYFKYIESRFLRIFPAYFIAMIICSLLSYFNQFQNNIAKHLLIELNVNYFSFYDFFTHISFVHFLENKKYFAINSVLWTIGVEFPFYIFIPIIAIYYKKHKIITTLFCFCIYLLFAKSASILHILRYLPFFLFGIMIYVDHEKLLFLKKFTKFIKIIAFILIVLLFYNKKQFFGGFILGFLMIIFNIKNYNNTFNNILVKLIVQIGKCSYSIYLYQFILNFKDYDPSVNNFIFLLLFTISFGSIMYYLIEKPFEKMRKNILIC